MASAVASGAISFSFGPASTRSSRTVRRIPRPLVQLPFMTWLEQPYRSWPRVSRFRRLPASEVNLPWWDSLLRLRPSGCASALFGPYLPARVLSKSAPARPRPRASWSGRERSSAGPVPDLRGLWPAACGKPTSGLRRRRVCQATLLSTDKDSEHRHDIWLDYSRVDQSVFRRTINKCPRERDGFLGGVTEIPTWPTCNGRVRRGPDEPWPPARPLVWRTEG